MATHPSILAYRITWTEDPGGLHSPWVPKESDMTETLTLSLSSYMWIPKPVTCKGNGITRMGLGKLHPHKA